MPLQTQQRVIPIHPRSIVDNANQRCASTPDHDFHPIRTRIQCILNQFFDDRGRTLNNLSSRNLTRDLVR
jgi:hypothetical protein